MRLIIRIGVCELLPGQGRGKGEATLAIRGRMLQLRRRPAAAHRRRHPVTLRPGAVQRGSVAAVALGGSLAPQREDSSALRLNVFSLLNARGKLGDLQEREPVQEST